MTIRHLCAFALLLPAFAVSQDPINATATLPAAAAPQATIVRPATMPHAITSFGACRVGPWLYVYGGHIGRAHAHSVDNVIGAFRRLNLVDGHSWQELPAGPALQGTALVAANDGTMYRVGGTDARNAPGEKSDMHSTTAVAHFDPQTAKWQSMTPLPEPRSSHDAIICGNMLYVVGGWNLQGDDGDWHQTAWVADVTKQPLEWQPLPTPGTKRRACAVATFGNRIAVLGGISGRKTVTSVQIYDPATKAWTDGPELPGFAFGTAALGIDGWLYATILDGRLLKWNGSPDTSWQPVAQMETPRFFHRMVPGLDGRILAFGGAGRGGHLRTMEHVAIDQKTRHEMREYVIPAPSQVAYRQALLLQDNTLWALGGNRGKRGERFAPEQFASDIWKIELATMTAKKVGDLPHGCQSMASSVWGNRAQNLVIGGLGTVDGKVQSLATGFRFDMRRMQAIPYDAQLDAPRTQCQTVYHEGKLYVIGGIDFTPNKRGGSTKGDTRDVLVYDTEADAPTFVRSRIRLPRVRRSHGAAVIGNKLYLIGGLGKGFSHAGPCDVYDFETESWSELEAPQNWVSPQVSVIGKRLYVACGGTMNGQSFKPDTAVTVFAPDSGWRTVCAELPFQTRHVRMLPHGNRLLFYSANDERGDRITIRTLEPDAMAIVPADSFHF